MPRLLPQLPLLGVLLVGPAARAQARSDQGLRTGEAHLVVVSTTPTVGLEEGIPRGSAYARGIALDIAGKWDESLRAYERAKEEFEAQLKSRPRWAAMIRGWILKAEFQIEQSRRLMPLRNQGWRYSSPYAYYSFSQTLARHNKWLAIRAFTGQDAQKLKEVILDEYARALRQTPYHDQARILLAAFQHEIGRHEEARREFAKVQNFERVWLAKEVAYYFAASGKLDDAFEYLEKSIKYRRYERRHILQSNDFDRLRGDPRFRKIAGEP